MKKIDVDYKRMLCAVLNKSSSTLQNSSCWPTYLPSQKRIRQTRHAGVYGRSKNELISFVLLWTSANEHTSVHQLCADTGCRLEDLQWVMADLDWWQERSKEIRTVDTPWWWWYMYSFSLFQISFFLYIGLILFIKKQVNLILYTVSNPVTCYLVIYIFSTINNYLFHSHRYFFSFFYPNISQVDWGCRIRRQYLHRGVNPRP